VYVQSDSEIIFDFNEPMDANSVATATIVLSGGEPLVANITLDNLDPKRVHVNTTQMVNQTVYQYVLSGLTDCWGNEAGQLSGHFGAPDVPSVGDLVINIV
jgi:hypothetical protein